MENRYLPVAKFVREFYEEPLPDSDVMDAARNLLGFMEILIQSDQMQKRGNNASNGSEYHTDKAERQPDRLRKRGGK